MALVFPVIDLLRGQAVRAAGGQRSRYRPVTSALCAGSDPLTVARALCAHSASSRLYVADLDALQGGEPQWAVLEALHHALPATELWVDAGLADVAAGLALRDRLGAAAAAVVPVFGSESLRSRAAFEGCFAPGQALAGEAALSLDRRGGQRLDAAGCWDAPDLWPRRVIVMTLDRVGSGAGPDLQTLAEVRHKAPGALLVGAGGIRDAADLDAAGAAGADAWLVASALHDRRL
jgi:phosphoribosylformimino-5-aminoimidazole carboxamide ribotide isomerase